MTEVDRSSQATPRSTQKSYLKSYYTVHKIMNATRNSQQPFGMRRSQSTIQMRVVDNNRRGRSIDKITEATMKVDPPQTKSIYQHDYTRKDTSRERELMNSARGFEERLNRGNYRSHSDLRGSLSEFRKSMNRSIDSNPPEDQSPPMRLHTE